MAILVIFMVISLFENTNLFAKPAPAVIDPDALIIRMLDVGQADAFLLTQGDAAMLIDCGNPGDEERLLPALSSYGVEKLDTLVLTHPHTDHIGGAAGLLKALPVEKIVVPGQVWDAGHYAALSTAIADAGASVYRTTPGDVYPLGDASFTILSPGEETDISDLNDASVCLRIGYAGRYALFTGDAGSAVEQQLLDSGAELRADILKASHHGSDTANSSDWLTAVDPSFIFISCREDSESDDLPAAEALSRLEATGASILRSDLHGVVTIVIDSRGEITVTSERNALT